MQLNYYLNMEELTYVLTTHGDTDMFDVSTHLDKVEDLFGIRELLDYNISNIFFYHEIVNIKEVNSRKIHKYLNYWEVFIFESIYQDLYENIVLEDEQYEDTLIAASRLVIAVMTDIRYMLEDVVSKEFYIDYDPNLIFVDEVIWYGLYEVLNNPDSTKTISVQIQVLIDDKMCY